MATAGPTVNVNGAAASAPVKAGLPAASKSVPPLAVGWSVVVFPSDCPNWLFDALIVSSFSDVSEYVVRPVPTVTVNVPRRTKPFVGPAVLPGLASSSNSRLLPAPWL